MNTTTIAVACVDASGMPEIPIFKVPVTPREIGLGVHYDKAKAQALDAGYQGPFICYDADEYSPILSAARSLDLVPQVVVIDITGGEVQSVFCDAGEIKVICFDRRTPVRKDEAVSIFPFGQNGELIRCRAHVEIADADPVLKNVRN